MDKKNETYNNILKSIVYDKKKIKKKRNTFIWEDQSIYKKFSLYKSRYSDENLLIFRVEWFIYIKKEKSFLNKIYSNNNNKWYILLGTMKSFYHSNDDFFEIPNENNFSEVNAAIKKINNFIENELSPFFQKIKSLEDIITMLKSSTKETERWHDPRSKEFSEDRTISECYLLLSQVDKSKTYLHSRKKEVEESDLLPGKKRGYIEQIDEFLENFDNLK